MTKCTWLTKPQNFERVPSNLLSRLIRGSFGWGFVAEMHAKEVKARLVYKLFTKCLIFLFNIPKDNKDFFHGCRHDYEHCEI
jgi:hypothetical protein